MNPKTVLAICFFAVMHAPTSRAVSLKKVVVENTTFNLTCSCRYRDGEAGPVFIWIIDGRTFTRGCYVYPYLGVYDPVTIDTAGTFTTKLSTLTGVISLNQSNANISCKMKCTDGDHFSNWTLQVEREPPCIITPDEGATFIEGAVSTLNCKSIYDVNITWSVGGKPFGEVVLPHSFPDVGTVSFIALRSQHHLELKCEIPSAVEGGNKPLPASEVVLSIVYPPFITSGRINGNPYTFWCDVDANPAANILWVGPEDYAIPMAMQRWTDENDYNDINRTRSELKVDPIYATGVGGYTCIASNAYGNSSATIPLAKKHLPLIIGLSVGVFSLGVVIIVLVFMVFMRWRPDEVTTPDPIYDSTLPEGSLGLTRRLSTFVTGTWKRGSWFGSVERSSVVLEMLDRPRLSIPVLDE